MKPLLVLPAICLLVLAGGCSPLNSGGDLLASGRDARVYNAATGRYEWPAADERPRPPRKSSATAAAIRSAPPATPAGDGRIYNLEKGRFEWPDSGAPATAPPSR